MHPADVAHFAISSIRAHRMRSFLTALGITIGITAVVLLTAIGEGVHRFILSEFTQFGTTLVAVTPGKTETFGISGALVNAVRPLSLEDAEALGRLRHIEAIVPMIQGNAEVEAGERKRHTFVFGVGAAVPQVWRIRVRLGRFLPADDPRAPRAYAVLGSKVRDELFPRAQPLGKRVRVGGERYRVIGVMERKGQLLGFDLDDAVYIPIGKALGLFNREGLMEIDLLYAEGAPLDEIVAAVRRLLVQRHGMEDFTIVTQQQMLDVLGAVLDVLTFAVGALGGISLLVGGIGILTIMTIAINERTGEIGLLRALGARRREILTLFLGEALVHATLGGTAGLALGVGLAQLLTLALPALPVHTSWGYLLLAELLAVGTGLAAGALPARRAAGLEPVQALRAE
jgi:putative ABC transport system permease protein